MLTCKQASALVSQSLDRRLSWRERLGLRLHLVICAACARFARQVRLLHAAARAFAEAGVAADLPARLSAPARQRIAESLRRQAGLD